MECPCILCLAVSETEAVFDMIYGALDGCADLINRLPFLCPADCSGIKTEILLRIKIDHAPAAGSRARIIAVADTAVFPVFAFLPAHFGTDELECFQAAAEMGSVTFRSHCHGRIAGTTGYSLLVDRVISACLRSPAVQRDIGTFKDPDGAISSNRPLSGQ